MNEETRTVKRLPAFGSEGNPGWAELSRKDLRGVNLSGAALIKADLPHKNLSGANLEGAHLWKANLWQTNLSGANLKEANLIGVSLRETDLTGALIRGMVVSDPEGNIYRVGE